MPPTTRNPRVLYLASLERMSAAWRLREVSPVEAVYLGGLAVECIVQAFAFENGSSHDARHDLQAWLGRCSFVVQDSIKRPPLSSHWSRVVAVWRNDIRYWDFDGLLGWARKQPQWRRLSGDDHARLVQLVKSFLQSADEVQKKAVARWQS